MADDLGERTEEATSKRRSEAREEGQVARSTDLASSLMLLAVTATLWAGGAWMLESAGLMLGGVLSGDYGGRLDAPTDAWAMIVVLLGGSVRIATPMLAAAFVAAYLVNFIQVGWMLSPKPLQPKLDKLNPLNGAKKIFGLSGVVKASLDLLKVSIVVGVTVLTTMQHSRRMIRLPHLDVLPALAEICAMAMDLSIRVVAVLLLLGILDWTYQKWKHSEDLKMTKQQVKDEMKQTEGDPEVKRRRIRMQQQIAMQRIGAAVPTADVIVTNPEHLAIAIKYDDAAMAAPKVIAKGADHLAMRIRHLATRHGIPIVERKPLARALYRSVEVGQEIPPEFYKAVAEILAYVYQLSERKTA